MPAEAAEGVLVGVYQLTRGGQTRSVVLTGVCGINAPTTASGKLPKRSRGSLTASQSCSHKATIEVNHLKGIGHCKLRSALIPQVAGHRLNRSQWVPDACVASSAALCSKTSSTRKLTTSCGSFTADLLSPTLCRAPWWELETALASEPRYQETSSLLQPVTKRHWGFGVRPAQAFPQLCIILATGP